MSARSLLVRGMLVGLVAGLLAYVFATVFGESLVDRAIAFEAAHAAEGAHGAGHEVEVVSRTVQSTLGLGVAAAVYGTAIGGLLALAFAVAYGRIGALGIRETSLLVALGGFVSVVLVPSLKYPANPPSVGGPDSVGQRTALYFLMTAVSVLAATGAVLVGRRLVPRLGAWDAGLVAVGGFAVVALAAGLAMPAVSEVPADFPAVLLWQFRIASLGTQLVLWASAGVLFGALTHRATRRTADAVRPPVPVG